MGVHLNFNNRKIKRNCVVRCSNGKLIWDVNKKKIIWSSKNGNQELKTYQNHPDYIYKKQLKHFFDCIENKKRPLVSINDGVAVLHMIDSIKKSSNIGEKVAIA